jgi:CRISPR system Cascade subunit CasB
MSQEEAIDRLASQFHRLASAIENDESQARATLAKLRRCLGKEFALDAIVFVESLHLPSWMTSSAAQIVPLFALYPKMGELSVAQALRQVQSKDPDAKGPERRIHALLASESEDLYARLRPVVQILKSHDQPIDWKQLLSDVLSWDYSRRPIQRRWAREFWGTPYSSIEETETFVTETNKEN